MATSVKARRTEISLWYNSTPVSDEIGPDVESLTYTDCASDTCDSIDIEVNARDEKWLNSWWPQQGATLHPKVTGLDWNLENDRWDKPEQPALEYQLEYWRALRFTIKHTQGGGGLRRTRGLPLTRGSRCVNLKERISVPGVEPGKNVNCPGSRDATPGGARSKNL